MFWFILLVLLFLSSFLAYKFGEIHELHKTRAAFEHYLEAHPVARELLKPGIEVAEQIVDELIEEETLITTD